MSLFRTSPPVTITSSSVSRIIMSGLSACCLIISLIFISPSQSLVIQAMPHLFLPSQIAPHKPAVTPSAYGIVFVLFSEKGFFLYRHLMMTDYVLDKPRRHVFWRSFFLHIAWDGQYYI